MNTNQDIRWRQRFQNFERAFVLLRNGLTEKPLAERSMLEQEGLIQRFEYTYELAWKTLKDYLDYTGYALQEISPRSVIKAAFTANIIADGEAWIGMVEQRNLMSHTYNKEAFQKILTAINERHFFALEQVHTWLKQRSA